MIIVNIYDSLYYVTLFIYFSLLIHCHLLIILKLFMKNSIRIFMRNMRKLKHKLMIKLISYERSSAFELVLD